MFSADVFLIFFGVLFIEIGISLLSEIILVYGFFADYGDYKVVKFSNYYDINN